MANKVDFCRECGYSNEQVFITMSDSFAAEQPYENAIFPKRKNILQAGAGKESSTQTAKVNELQRLEHHQ